MEEEEVIKIIVNELPKNCARCLFIGKIQDKNLLSKNISFYSGCTLSKYKIPFEIGISYRMPNCPLQTLNEYSQEEK